MTLFAQQPHQPPNKSFSPSLLRVACCSYFHKTRPQQSLHLTDNIIAMLLQPQTALSSLKKIAEMCQSGSSFTSSVMGVVVDMTRPLYRQRDKDYIVEVKIVDELVNDSEVFGVMVKYCSLYLFSKDKKELEVCNQIGQILLLDSFTFSLWNQIKLETKYRSTIEKLYTFDHSHGNLALFNFLSRTAKDSNDARSEDVLFRADKLAEWFSSYFCEKYHPTLGISLVNNYCVMAEPFNMILMRWEGKMEEVLEKSVSNHFALADSHGNRFIIDRDCLPSLLPASQFLYIRNIRYIGNFYEIMLTETGYALGLPMSKASYYQRQMNYCAISRFNERFLLRNHKTCNLSKVNYVCPKTTPVLELLNQMDLYENKFSMKEELRMEDLYMIECVAVNFQGKLHMFHSELQMIADEDYVANLNDDERTELIQKGILEYLYEGVIGVIDRSSECTGRLLYVHLFTNQKRARFFEAGVIEQLNKKAGLPKEKNTEEEEKVTEEIESKLRKLIEKSDFTNTVSMLLEPIKSDVLIYRLTNTVFI